MNTLRQSIASEKVYLILDSEHKNTGQYRITLQNKTK